MHKISVYWAVGVLLILLSACSKKEDLSSPELVLERYVKTAINAKAGGDRTSLFNYLTGKALERIKSMSDKDFFEVLVKPEYKFVHFSTRNFQAQTGNRGSLVYELVYQNAATDEVPVQVTVRKIAYFVQVDGKEWKISDTRNIKSFVEMKKGMQVQFP